MSTFEYQKELGNLFKLHKSIGITLSAEKAYYRAVKEFVVKYPDWVPSQSIIDNLPGFDMRQVMRDLVDARSKIDDGPTRTEMKELAQCTFAKDSSM